MISGSDAPTMTMAGVSQRAVMAMLGHRDPRMTVRYKHFSPEHLHDAAKALDERPHEHTSNGTISAPGSGRPRKPPNFDGT